MKKKATKADKYFEGYGTKKAKTPPPKEAVTQREMDNYEWKGLKIKNPRAPKFDAKGNPVAKKGAAATKYLKTKK